MTKPKILDRIGDVLQKYKDEELTSTDAKTEILEALVRNSMDVDRYLIVLAEEISSYAYRQGFKDGSGSNPIYNFTEFKTTYIDELRNSILDTLKMLVNIQ